MISLEREIYLLENFRHSGNLGDDKQDERMVVNRAIRERLSDLHRERFRRENKCPKCGGFGFSCYC